MTRIRYLQKNCFSTKDILLQCLDNVCGSSDDPKDCSGNGICENDDSENGYSCYCEPGYYGDDCELCKNKTWVKFQNIKSPLSILC